MAHDLSTDVIGGALTGRFGRLFKYVEVTGSTNSDALEWAEHGAPEGALVVADHQTAGRGRWGRTWLSRPGSGLLFSLVLRPDELAAAMGLLTTAAGVACAEGIEGATGLPAGIKWPNDVMVNGRKVAGILVETRSAGSKLDIAIVGVGINVHGRPAAVGDGATSLAAEAGSAPARAEVLAAVLDALERLYRAGPDVVIERATARSDVLGRRVRVRFADGSSLDGVAARLLESGALEVDDDGLLVDVRAGEIEHLRLGSGR
jgi:BirA family biotin operon repressor/biotin-[acetyl-CoA-carboxylase] ligase